MHSEAFDVGCNGKYIREILWTSPNNVSPPPQKKLYLGATDPLTTPLHRRLWLEIGGGILWNSLPSEIKASETKTVDYRFC